MELAANRTWREHGDIDVLVLRPEMGLVAAWMQAWDVWAAEPPGRLRVWRADEPLPAHVHDLWCRTGPDDDWRLQLMVDDAVGDRWRSRRDPTLTLPLDRLGQVTGTGAPYLRPQVQLFAKAWKPRPKDAQDFFECAGLLDQPARRWLADAIAGCIDGNHFWLAELGAPRR